jgi:hypothetical protein
MPFSFALSNDTPMYRRLPSRAEWEKEERFLGKPGSFRPQSWGNRGHEKLAEVRAIAPTDAKPWFFADGGSVGREKPHGLKRRLIPHGSMLAYTRAFTHEGRTFVLSADGTAVPADRIRPFRVSKFRGTELGKGVQLPLAFFRQKARPKFLRKADGSFEALSEQFPVRSFVGLEPGADAVRAGRDSYIPTRASDAQGNAIWTKESDATVIQKRDGRPIGVAAGEKWLLISITNGTLVAYED